MNPTNLVKRAPRWAWFAAAGVGIGAVGVHMYRNRGAEGDTAQTPTTVGGGTTPGPLGSSPTPVIVPPVITQTDGGGEANAAGILTAVSGVFAPVIDNLSGLVQTTVGSNETNLATYSSGLFSIADRAITGVGSNNEAWLALLASGGLAPQPAAAQPSVINVNVPSPTPVQTGTATTSPALKCPSSYPNHNPSRGAPGPKSCYQNVGHDECHAGKKSREHANLYQDGTRVTTGWDVIGGKC